MCHRKLKSALTGNGVLPAVWQLPDAHSNRTPAALAAAGPPSSVREIALWLKKRQDGPEINLLGAVF